MSFRLRRGGVGGRLGLGIDDIARYPPISGDAVVGSGIGLVTGEEDVIMLVTPETGVVALASTGQSAACFAPTVVELQRCVKPLSQRH
jgi:hypothetical protein